MLYKTIKIEDSKETLSKIASAIVLTADRPIEILNKRFAVFKLSRSQRNHLENLHKPRADPSLLEQKE